MNNVSFLNHLRKRGFFDANPRCWIDYETESVTFPLWSPAGNLVGYQWYRWRLEKLRSNEGRYFTYISHLHRPFGVWGLEHIVTRKDEPLFITEGIWDAIRVIGAGYRACSVLTATPNKEFRNWFAFLTEGQNTIVLADDDKAGNSLKKVGRFAHTVEGGKDMSDLSPAKSRRFLERVLCEHL